MKGNHHSPKTEFKKGKAPWNKDKKCPELSGKNNHFYGKKHTKKSREKMGCSGEEHYLYKKNYEEVFGGKKAKEIRRKISEGKLGDKNPVKREAVRKKISKTKIRLYKEGKIKRINSGSITKERRAKQVFPMKDTKIEVKIQSFLKRLGIEFFTHQYMKIEHGYQCDILIPSMNLVIECDGDFIHCNPIKYPSNFVRYPSAKKVITAQEIWDRDKIRTEELVEKGFRVLRLWEVEIKKMDINNFQNKIETFK